MDVLLLLPFLVQTVAIGLDETYFHIKRGLPKWERIGHPLDTLSVIACLLFVLLVPYSSGALKVFIGLAIFSCLMVTKDEFVHKHHCPAAEHWLHAILFITHPIMLASLGLIWGRDMLIFFPFLYVQLVLISLFFLYQVIYWKFTWKEEKQK